MSVCVFYLLPVIIREARGLQGHGDQMVSPPQACRAPIRGVLLTHRSRTGVAVGGAFGLGPQALLPRARPSPAVLSCHLFLGPSFSPQKPIEKTT